jgi:23S rRNA (cytidine1920-2'-O)/16S rRNA (cytidine1409-2'-O)-methyltransferase
VTKGKVRGVADKTRIDSYLFEHGLAPSREKAKALVMAGEVFVNGQRCAKPSQNLDEGQTVTVRQKQEFVSRGGKKIKKALDFFDIDINGVTAIDVGASTGGFTDCMLQRGAAHVYAVDVGHGQLAWSLRQDPRVTVMERQNARHLKPEMFESAVSFASIDVSFISLKLILPALKDVLTPPYTIAALIKPQFEAGRGKVGKKGVVRDPLVHIEVIEGVLTYARDMGFSLFGLTHSPIKGPEGNIEYLVCLKDSGDDIRPNVEDVVKKAHSSAV